MALFIKGTECGGCSGCTNDPCDPSPDAPSATLLCDSISASATKCGHDEFGTPSSPPKKYLVKTQTGGINQAAGSGSTQEDTYNTWSGAHTFARPGCSETDTRQVAIRRVLGSDVGGPCDATDTITTAAGRIDGFGDWAIGTDNGCNLLQLSVNCNTGSGVSVDVCCTGGGGTVVSTTVKTFAASGDCSLGGVSGSTVTLTLSDEYTTAQLISDVVAALPSYPGTWVGTCSSFRDLEADELTYTIRRFKYKFQLPDLTGFTCYKITWDEVFTPDVGSPYILNNRVYDWNGLASETGEWEIDEQSSNGSVTIENVVVTCECP